MAEEARDLGINMSAVAEKAIARAAKAERNRRWVETNRAALDAYAAEVEREGLPLAKHRTL
ncbi:MAG TPA: type II toxin-antitoxin system CcdA family antitoxin [Paracoccaceae bacterium]|nr:type II toxin-antitoxin system CcdA family antitoxin [Paracoccaceae bacterium]